MVAFGVQGGSGTNTYYSNMDSYDKSGVYLTNTTGLTNIPSGWSTSGRKQIEVHITSNYRKQVITDLGLNESYQRTDNAAGTWGSWKKLTP